MIENERPAAPDSREEAPRLRLPVLPPTTAILEIIVLLGIPAALDYFWPAFPSLSDMQPHVFWLPVLLLSLQYGTVSGLAAASVAILLSALLGWPDQEVGENHFSYLLRIWAQPVLWLLAALVLGQFRMRQIEQKQALARELADMASQRTAIADYATNLRGRCEALEREIACQRLPSAHALLDALARARSGRTDAGGALAECMALAFGPCRASLYASEVDGLRLVASHGTDASAGAREAYPAGHPLDAIVVRDGRELSVLVPGDEAVLGPDGLVAVPVLSPADNRVAGVLKIDAMDASELDAGTSLRLAVVAMQLAPLVTAGAPYAARPRLEAVQRPGARLGLLRQVRWRRAGKEAAAAFRSSRAS